MGASGSQGGGDGAGKAAAAGAGGALTGAAAGSAAGPYGAAAGAIVGAGIGIYGALSSASDQADLDAKKAAVAEEQAQEIQAREAANENLRNQAAYRAKLAFGAAFAGSGKAGTGIGSQLEIQRQTDLQNVVSNRDSQFQEAMLRQQAGIDQQLGQDTMKAGYISAAATAIGAAGKVYGDFNPPKTAQPTGTQSFG